MHLEHFENQNRNRKAQKTNIESKQIKVGSHSVKFNETEFANMTSPTTAKSVKCRITQRPTPTLTRTLKRKAKVPRTRNPQQWQPQPRMLLRTAIICILAIVLNVIPAANSDLLIFGDANQALIPVVYSNFSNNATYISSTENDSRGMQPLYDMTYKVMALFVGRKPLPRGYIAVHDMKVDFGPKVDRNEWGDLIKQYWATLLLVAFMTILIIAMPIVGICFCCCRCVGACGGRSEPFDKQHDTFKRVCYAFILILLVIGLLFGVIVAFTTNGFMHTGVYEAPTAVLEGSADTQEFLTHTSREVDHVLITNFNELARRLKTSLNDTSAYIIEQLEVKSQAISLMYLTDFLTKLPEVRAMLMKMKELTNFLRIYASQLSDGLRGVKRELLVMLTKCNVSACQEVLNKYEIGKLDVDGVRYDSLPDVTNIIDQLAQIIAENIAQAGYNGRDNLKHLRVEIKSSIANITPEIVAAIDNAGLGFENTSNEIKTELTEFSKSIGNHSNHYTGVADKFIDDYTPYRFYIGLAVCIVLLLVLVSLVVALMCGVCGKRPGGYGDDCCNKGAGSRFLMIAVCLIFLSFSFIAVAALIHFLIGVVAYRGICVPLQDPENDAVFAEVDECVDLNRVLYPSLAKGRPASGSLPPFRISHVINACKANQSIYEVLRIHNRVDINEIKDYSQKYKINETLQKLVSGIDVQNMKTLTILTPQDKQRILELGQSTLASFESSQFINNVGDDITKYSLNDIANQLRLTANKITSEDLKDVQISLRNQALHLVTYEQNLVLPMKNHTTELTELAYLLDKSLRYKDLSFKESIPLLVDEITKAQTFINTSGRDFVRNTAQKMAEFFASEVNNYLNRVIYMVENEIGTCEPMATVYDSSIVAVCNRVVDPLNGFWAALFWCLLLFLPILVVSILLAGLYQKSDPYPGPLVESEYLYDAYSERDHIPLANGPKNKRRKNKDHRRRGEYYEDAVGPATHGSHGAHGVPPPAAGVRDTRYNDMAPKHWDGGPPRYQNPPMAPPASEYERPPPYYYPGATEQD